jgi:sensor histidine kinase YesM
MPLQRKLILLLFFLLPLYSGYGKGMAEIKLSELYQQGSIPLFKAEYLKDSSVSLYDTVRIDFILVNDLGRDTNFVYKESLNEWIQFDAFSHDNKQVIHKISGRNFYSVIPYDNIYYPAQSFRIDSGAVLTCHIKYKGVAYSPARIWVALMSPQQYQANLAGHWKVENTNFTITYVFIGAITFGFFFFLFLFYKSHFKIFGLYALFLLLQALYGFIQIDAYTRIGHFLLTYYNFDDYANEFLAFSAQAVYVTFIANWLGIKSTHPKIYYAFRGLGYFFFSYATAVLLIYTFDRYNPVIDRLEQGMRMLLVVFQLVVFYLLIFKIKSPVKSYVLTGTALMTFFGVIMVYLAMKEVFLNSYFDDLDYGSWYMIGILAESMCFAMGLGLKYFHITQENTRLQQENINALQDKLASEKEARDTERMLSAVNLELTNQQLTALRAQMNPHFIFNALNSIQKYILMGNVDQANSYLSKFSKLQRMILSYCDEDFITLDKEINMLGLYLEIEQLRLTNDFSFSITHDDDMDPDEIQIPPMMLQPFAENAVWHGLVPKEGAKTLHIHFTMADDDNLKCIVEDNGIGREAARKIKEEIQGDPTTHKSKGLSLVYKRLAILERKYGKEFSVNIRDKTDKANIGLGTVIELNIPVTD